MGCSRGWKLQHIMASVRHFPFGLHHARPLLCPPWCWLFCDQHYPPSRTILLDPAQQIIIIHLISLPLNLIIHPHWQSHSAPNQPQPTPPHPHPPLFHWITADSHSSHPSQSAMYLSLPGAINFPRRVNSPWGRLTHFRPLSADATTEAPPPQVSRDLIIPPADILNPLPPPCFP